MRSIRFQVAVSFGVLAFAVVCTGFVAYYFQSEDALLELTDDDLMARAKSVAQLVQRDGDGVQLSEDLRRTESLSSVRPLRGFVVRSGGATLVASASLDSQPDVVAAIEGVGETPRRGVTVTRERGADLRVVRTRLRADKEPLDVFAVASLAEVQEEMSEIVHGLLAAAIPAGLLALACGWIASRRISRPVVAIADAAQRVEAGDGAAVIPQGGPKEIARLAETVQRSFDRISAALTRERRFNSDASHELRTPLASILVDAEVTLEHPRDDESYRRTLRNVVLSARRMQRTVESLLFLARFEATPPDAKPQWSDVSEALLDAAAAVATRAAERGVSVATPADVTLACAVDPSLLALLLRNLLANAVEHGKERGRVEVRARQDGSSTMVEVQDDGAGFPPHVLARAFEPFVRGDPARGSGGAGLGLSIVKRIADAYGGSVTLANAPSGGALVVVRLPAAP